MFVLPLPAFALLTRKEPCWTSLTGLGAQCGSGYRLCWPWSQPETQATSNVLSLWVWATFVPHSLVLPCPTEQVGLVWAIGVGQGMTHGILASVRDLDCFWYAACVSASNGCLSLLRCHLASEPALCLTAKLSLWFWQPLPQFGGVSWNKLKQSICADQAGVCVRIVVGHWPVTCAVSVFPLHPFSESKQACAHSSWAESRLPRATLLVPLTLQPTKGTHFTRVRPQGWGTQHVAWTAYSPGRIATWGRYNLPSLWIPSQGYRFYFDHFSLLTWFYMCFSYSLGYIGVLLPVSRKFFYDNCSTCRFIFHAIYGGGEFCILLFAIFFHPLKKFIVRNWLTYLWRVRSLTVCHLQTGDLRKQVV